MVSTRQIVPYNAFGYIEYTVLSLSFRIVPSPVISKERGVTPASPRNSLLPQRLNLSLIPVVDFW